VTSRDSAQFRSSADDYLQVQAARLIEDGIGVDTAIATGDPASEIASYAKSHGVNLIVVATRGVGPHSIRVLTSVTDEVLAQSPCPVLAFCRGARQPGSFHQVLVPVDGSPGAALALAAARALTRPGEARITLMDVVVPVPAAAYAGLAGMTVGGYIDADVIVMSTHSVKWPARLFVGSVAEHIIRESARPVLLVTREAAPD
jgi:nucleotide-binding universal stress UspA family protein